MKMINSKLINILIRPKLKIKSRQWWILKFKRLKKILRSCLPKNKVLLSNQSTFSLLLTNNKEIQYLNKKFRKKNKPTDVLSFYLIEKEQKNNKYLGDIVISIETAKKQASKEKITIEEELLKLFIHGYLHLLGYDHKKSKEAKVMFLLQEKFLQKIL